MFRADFGVTLIHINSGRIGGWFDPDVLDPPRSPYTCPREPPVVVCMGEKETRPSPSTLVSPTRPDYPNSFSDEPPELRYLASTGP